MSGFGRRTGDRKKWHDDGKNEYRTNRGKTSDRMETRNCKKAPPHHTRQVEFRMTIEANDVTRRRRGWKRRETCSVAILRRDDIKSTPETATSSFRHFSIRTMSEMPTVLPVLSAEEVDEYFRLNSKEVKPLEFSYSAALLKSKNGYYNVGLDRYMMGEFDPSRIARCVVFNKDYNRASSRSQLFRLGSIVQDALTTPFQPVDAKKVLRDTLHHLKEWEEKSEMAKLKRPHAKTVSAPKPKRNESKTATGYQYSTSSIAGTSSSTARESHQQPCSSSTFTTGARFLFPAQQKLPSMTVREAVKAGFIGFDIDESPSTSESKKKQTTMYPVKVVPNPIRKRHLQ